LFADTTIADIRHDADDLDFRADRRPDAQRNATAERIAPAEIPFREDLIDDGDRMSALALQPHVALIEVSSGNDPGAECREESRA
jgi:hypothetical protein